MPQHDRPDPSSLLARPDLAEQALEGLVRAAAYRETRAYQATRPAMAIRAAARETAFRLDTLLFGEIFDVLDITGGFAWGRARRTGAVGHVALEGLDAEILLPTHRVRATDAALPLNALITVISTDDGVVTAARAGDLRAAEVAEIGGFEADAASVAEALIDAPYAPGGREPSGVDAAGLVQQALAAAGRGGERSLRVRVACSTAVALPLRGDLAVWPNHVGLMIDAEHMIHASPACGGVVIETLAAVTRRQGDAPVWMRP